MSVMQQIHQFLGFLGGPPYSREDVLLAIRQHDGYPPSPLVERTVELLAYFPSFVEVAYLAYSDPAGTPATIAAAADHLVHLFSHDELDPAGAICRLAFEHSQMAYCCADQGYMPHDIARRTVAGFGTCFVVDGIVQARFCRVEPTPGKFAALEMKMLRKSARRYMAAADMPVDLDALRFGVACGILDEVARNERRAA